MAGPSKRRLGRGLDGLLPASPEPASSNERDATGVAQVPIEDLEPSHAQPRRSFDEEALDELAQSIREHGILEPILVRRNANGRYTIVAGERRWRAAQKAGYKELPVFVRELTEGTAFEAALVENLQREDLNPIETARAFQRLIDEHEHSQDTVAERVGKNRSTVANALRLLKLPDDILDMIESRDLSEGHGRALLGADDVETMRKLARMAVRKSLSVREVERRVRGSSGGRHKKKPTKGTAAKSANVRALERRLEQALGSSVSIEDENGKGRVVLSYASWDELDGIISKITS